jgi:hypothetical protein
MVTMHASGPSGAQGGAIPASRRLLCALLWAALATVLLSVHALWAWRAGLVPELGRRYVLLCALVLGTGALQLAALGRAHRERRQRVPGALLRSAWVLAVVVAATHVALYPSLREPYLACGFALGGGALASLVLVPAGLALWTRFLDRPLFGLATSVFLAELCLRIAAPLLDPVILADQNATLEWLDSHRLRPGELRFGFPVNSRGDYDAEPPVSGAGPLVVVIGDSFSASSVALPLHYTSLLEEELGVPVYNMGAIGANPATYLELLRREALPMRPDVVVVGLFAGNDLSFQPADYQVPGFLRSFVDRQGCLLARFLQRALRVARERLRSPSGQAAAVQGEGAGPVDPQAVLASFPWLADPLLEQPTFSEQAFRRIEGERAEAIARADRPAEYTLYPWLDALAGAAGAVPLVFLLIPDEFQVEDLVWEDVLADARVALDRERPQRELGEFFARRGLRWVDLLPELRAVQPLADGRRHVYHLRDTHFNARGNQVAARALLPVVRELLAQRAAQSSGSAPSAPDR